jgi:hypothetical protein
MQVMEQRRQSWTVQRDFERIDFIVPHVVARDVDDEDGHRQQRDPDVDRGGPPGKRRRG